MGIVTALAFEARSLGVLKPRSEHVLILRDAPFGETIVSISGMGGERARDAARNLVRAGSSALLSWGTAGALDPALKSCTAVLPTEVIASDLSGRHTRFRTDPLWRKRIVNALAGHTPVVQGALLTHTVPVATADTKAELFNSTAALAVDMESAAVAEVAAEHGLPFVTIRVILDTAFDTLPEALVRAIEADLHGDSRRMNPSLLLLRAPSQWRQLARLAGRYRSASKTLRNCAQGALIKPRENLRESTA